MKEMKWKAHLLLGGGLVVSRINGWYYLGAVHGKDTDGGHAILLLAVTRAARVGVLVDRLRQGNLDNGAIQIGPWKGRTPYTL